MPRLNPRSLLGYVKLFAAVYATILFTKHIIKLHQQSNAIHYPNLPVGYLRLYRSPLVPEPPAHHPYSETFILQEPGHNMYTLPRRHMRLPQLMRKVLGEKRHRQRRKVQRLQRPTVDAEGGVQVRYRFGDVEFTFID